MIRGKFMFDKPASVPYSVLMPVYYKDDPDWFSLAVDSVLNQTIKPSEIIIVADGPLTPELYEIIENKKAGSGNLIKCLFLPENKGTGEALKSGVEVCSNEWIVRMDADDYSAPNRCEVQFAAQIKNHADMIGCDIDEFTGAPENVISHRVFPETHDEIVRFGKRRTPFPHPGIIMKKSQILQAGNYRSALYHEDYDLFVRMLMNGCKGYNVKQPLVSMRVNENFYTRRGSIHYLKQLLNFNCYLYKIGWMSITDFSVRSAANIITCLLPNSIRKIIYKKLLRK